MTWQAATTSYPFSSGELFYRAVVHRYDRASRRTKSWECPHKHRSKNSAQKCADRSAQQRNAQLDSKSARRAD